jgi:hypothetical protein
MGKVRGGPRRDTAIPVVMPRLSGSAGHAGTNGAAHSWAYLGVTRQPEGAVKKSIGIAVLSGALALGGVAWAQGNSEPGLERYLANPGRQQAGEVGAQCGTGAGSGAFGFFGKDFSLAGGANGELTGINNSAVCGNRQGNLP